MKKTILALLSVVALLSFSPFSFADKTTANAKVFGHVMDPNSKPLSVKGASWATEGMIINNTPDMISVEIPYDVYDWLPGNRAYQIQTNIGAVNVRLWHPDFGYVYDGYIYNYTILSFAIEYGRPNVITVQYH